MIIYRYEDKDGYGPYNSSKRVTNTDLNIVLRQHDDCVDHPCPSKDFDCPCSMLDVRYGFCSMADLEAWFTVEVRELLKIAGFSVVKYDVPVCSIQMGKKQVRFDNSKANRMIGFESEAMV